MQEPRSYRTLAGDLRAHVRAYIEKQLLLPRQEIGELVRANLRAALWIATGAAFVFLALIAVVVFLVALVALVLPAWAAALVVLVACAALGGLFVYLGVRRLRLRGPERTIRSVKDTVAWLKATLLGRSAS